MSHFLDRQDRKILAMLQQNCRQSLSDIAEHAGLSKSACHRRVSALQDNGFISRFTAVLNPEALGYALIFAVEVRLKGQSHDEMEEFERAIMKIPQIMECHLMTGQTDYFLRVAARSADDYEKLHHELARLPGVSNLVSGLVLRTVKQISGPPV